MTIQKRRRIYLMRHGSVTYFDTEGRPHLPEMVPLNELGRAQATAAGQVFAAENLRFDRVIVSGLPRTVETATRVLNETGQQIALEQWPDLEEIRGGKLASISDGDLHEAFNGAFEGVVPNLMRRYRETDSDYMRTEIEQYMRLKIWRRIDRPVDRPGLSVDRPPARRSGMGHRIAGAAWRRQSRDPVACVDRATTIPGQSGADCRLHQCTRRRAGCQRLGSANRELFAAIATAR